MNIALLLITGGVPSAIQVGGFFGSIYKESSMLVRINERWIQRPRHQLSD